MAKKEKAAETKSSGKVTVQDLATKYKMEGRKIRAAIRELGIRAPELPQDGTFGPRAKYEWDAGDKDLAKIEAKLAELANGAAEKPAKKEKKAKDEKPAKKSKKEEESDEDDSDEDDDSEDEDEEDEE